MIKGAPRARAEESWSLGIAWTAPHDGAKVALGLAVGLLYYAAAELGLALRFPDIGLPAIWPSIGVLAALLLLTPREYWWIVWLAAATAHFAAHWNAGLDWTELSWRLLCHLALATAVGAMVRRVYAGRDPFGRPRDLIIYVSLAVIVIPYVAAWTMPEVVAALRTGRAETVARVWLRTAHAYALPLLTLTPALYLWLQRGGAWLRQGRPLQYVEAAVIGIAVLAINSRVADDRAAQYALLYLFLLPLLWAAVRFGVGGAATSAAVGVLMWTAAGPVPDEFLILDAQLAGLLDLQIYLFTTSLAALILGAVSEERARTGRALADSELNYRTIVEGQTELVCRNLPDTTLTFVNEAYCRFFRQERDQLLGRKWIELLPPESHSAVRASLARLTRSHPVLVHEHEVLLPDGGVGWMQWVDHAVFDDRGLVEVHCVGRDMTALKQVERSLRESDQRFRLVLRATKDVIYDWDVARDVLWSSAHGESAWPEGPSSPSNLKQWAQGLYPEDRERYLSDLAAVLKSAEDYWEIEYRYERAGAPMQHVHERACILRDAQGVALRMIGSVADITDRKRLEEARQAFAQVARLATLGEISASIAHEINQPLAAILNNSETGLALLMKYRSAPDEITEIVGDIRQDVLRASDIVQRLAVLLRGQEALLQPLAIDDVVQHSASLLRTEFRRRRAQLDVRCDSQAMVMGDPARLQQVMLNLMLNALDATSTRPEANRRILVSTRRTPEGRVQVDVADTGVGVPVDRMNTIFDSFVTTKPSGMGLGLAVTRSILKAHGGRVWATNNADGVGATFSFELALADAAGASGAPSETLGNGVKH